jgi:hypothetical protein
MRGRISFAFALASLVGCKESKSQSDQEFANLTQFRDSLRKSPDHVRGGADLVVATKDPEAIFRFVRDQIAVYPGPPHTGTLLDTQMRWGVRGTLRAGAGTPREKAALLVALYQRAGFTAKVVSGFLNVGDSAVQGIFTRSIPRVFDPPVDDATLDGWRKTAGLYSPAPSIGALDDHGVESSALANTLLAALPPGNVGTDVLGYSDVLGQPLPLVQVMVNGQPKYANPLLATAQFGMPYTSGDPVDASPADAPLPVHVTLAVSTTSDPTARTTVADGMWSAEDLIGRRLHVQFRPTVDVELYDQVRLADVQSWKPMLVVRGADVDDATLAMLSVGGTVISSAGQALDVKADDSVTLDGEPLSTNTIFDDTASAKVASITVAARAAAFPNISLRVSALDAGGRPVGGLPANAFQLSEDGVGRGFLVTGNQVPPLRVLLLFDLDSNFANGDAPATLARALATQVLAAHPDAAFQVATVGNGAYPTRDGFTLSTPDAVVNALAADITVGSPIWEYLAAAMDANPSVVVMASDFLSDDGSGIAGYRSRVARGAPVVAIGTGPFDMATRDDIAALTSGKVVNANDAASAASATADYLGQTQLSPYVLEYVAPVSGAMQRTVKLTTSKSVTGQATYTVPATAASVLPKALAGIYLTVSVGSETTTRVLAGWSSPQRPGADEVIPPSVLGDVRGALFGDTQLSFEGASPGLAAWMDDFLTMKIAAKPLRDAVANKDHAAVLKVLSGNLPLLSGRLPGLHPPIVGAADGTIATFEEGLRVVL